MNLPGILRHFQADVVTERDTSFGRVTLHRRSRFDLERGRLEKLWTYFIAGREPIRRRTSVRLYLPSTLAEMLRRAGFAEVELYGNTQGERLGLDHLRCIAVARRPA